MLAPLRVLEQAHGEWFEERLRPAQRTSRSMSSARARLAVLQARAARILSSMSFASALPALRKVRAQRTSSSKSLAGERQVAPKIRARRILSLTPCAQARQQRPVRRHAACPANTSPSVQWTEAHVRAASKPAAVRGQRHRPHCASHRAAARVSKENCYRPGSCVSSWQLHWRVPHDCRFAPRCKHCGEREQLDPPGLGLHREFGDDSFHFEALA